MDQILSDLDYPDVSLLENDKKLQDGIKAVTSFKELGDSLCVYRWSEEKVLDWLGGRVSKLQAVFKDQDYLHPAIQRDEKALERYCWGILGDYVRPELHSALKAHLGIQDPLIPINNAPPPPKRTKSAANPATSPALDLPKEEVKEMKEKTLSTAQKKLAKASSGTKSLTSFFKSK